MRNPATPSVDQLLALLTVIEAGSLGVPGRFVGKLSSSARSARAIRSGFRG
jgi:hypothetical protein